MFKLTERDLEILKCLGQYHILRMGQIKKLVFSDADIQVCRKRLKRLIDSYLITFIDPPKHSKIPERIFVLTSSGKDLLQHNLPDTKFPLFKKPDLKQYQSLVHQLEINEFRISLGQSVANHSMVELANLVSKNEIWVNFRKKQGMKRFRLYQEMHQTGKNQPLRWFPGMRFILQGRGEYLGQKRLFFFEIDQHKDIEVFREKIMAYSLWYKRNQTYLENFGNTFKVLIQCRGVKRVRFLRKSCLHLEGSEHFWITHEDLVNQNMLTAPIWTDHQLEQQSILKT